MTPTMSEYFDSWKNSRFIAGDVTTQRDFVAISRLADIQDILGGLQVVYAGVQPQVASADAALAEQIAADYASLNAFVAGVYAKEQSGHRYTPEDADLLGKEAQDRATAITGQLAQVAAQLGVAVQASAPGKIVSHV
jgi:iron uptake system EfeUOB component EfeO/EfeM